MATKAVEAGMVLFKGDEEMKTDKERIEEMESQIANQQSEIQVLQADLASLYESVRALWRAENGRDE